MQLYDARGHRRILPPLRVRRRRAPAPAAPRPRYDVVHTASFPYFSLLAAAAAAAAAAATGSSSTGTSCGARAYWHEYLGGAGGGSGGRVQRLLRARAAARVLLLAPARATGCARRACAARSRCSRASTPASLGAASRSRREPLVVFAGRHIPEKRAAALVPAIAPARERIPELRARIRSATGPSARRAGAIARTRRGRTSMAARLRRRRAGRATRSRRALCMVLPSRREGYGLVVVEAAASGTPSVVVATRTTPPSS